VAIFELLRKLGVVAITSVGAVVLWRALGPHYPVKEWLIWRLLPIWGYTLLFNAACVSGGACILRYVLRVRGLPAFEQLLMAMAVGVVEFALLHYLAGAVCAFSAWSALAIPLAMLASGAVLVAELIRELTAWRVRLRVAAGGAGPWVFVATLWGGWCLGLMYLGALAPSAVNFDAAWYHFPTAQDYARIGCLVPFPGENHRAYPHLTSILHTWALLVPGFELRPLNWMLSLHLEYSLVLWRIVGVVAAVRWMLAGQDRRGIWVAFFLFPSIFIYDQNIGGSADHVLGFFAAPVLLALARSLGALDPRRLALLGVVLAGHVLTKYQAIYLVFAVAVVLSVRFVWCAGREVFRRPRRLGWRRLAVAPLVLCGTLLLVSSPHFVKNVVFYGNPVYPFLQSRFPASHPKRVQGPYEEAPVREAFAPKHEGLRRQLWVGEMVFRFPFHTANRNFTEHRPYMGALFSLLLPCLLFVRRGARIRIATAVGLLAFFAWANTAANDRYMLAFLDVFIAVAAALILRIWELGLLARVGLVPLVALQLFWGADAGLFYGAKRIKAGLELLAAGYDGRYDDERFGFQKGPRAIADALPPDAIVLARNYKALLGLERTVLSDIRSAQDYIPYSNVKDPREFWEMLHARGVTHLLYPVGERRPPRWNNIVLFGELFHRYAERPKRIGGVALAELPATSPPKTQPYLVLLLRVKGYPDGLYRVEQLDLDERSPERFTPKPKPLVRWPGGGDPALMARAHALGICRGASPGTGEAALRERFESVERWSDCELYLRRK
jgi:hypothetical protein